MSNAIAKFYKVSKDQFIDDCLKIMYKNKQADVDEDTAGFDSTEWIKQKLSQTWEDIQLPKRSTSGSAGYDFFAPYEFTISGLHYNTVMTGIRCEIEPGWVLLCVPRSSLGFKYGFRLANTIGVIDSDYFNANNEGHIAAKILSTTTTKIDKGERFMQGIFVPYGITVDDECGVLRTGGIGSTGK